MNIMNHSYSENFPILYVDAKGNLSAVNEFKAIADYYGKTPYIFSETKHGNMNFNPFKKLNHTQKAILILNSFEWSDGEARYYKDKTIMALLDKIFKHIEKDGLNISLPEIYRYTKLHYESKETDGFLAQLALIVTSPFGPLFEDRDKKAVCIQEIIESKNCAYFGLSVMGYGALAKTIGKLFLSEMQIVAHELGLLTETSDGDPEYPVFLINDEAGSILYDEAIKANCARNPSVSLDS